MSDLYQCIVSARETDPCKIWYSSICFNYRFVINHKLSASSHTLAFLILGKLLEASRFSWSSLKIKQAGSLISKQCSCYSGFSCTLASVEVIWWQEAKHTIQWVQTADQQPTLANEQGAPSTANEVL
jgi:hypothetical protein